MTRPIRISEYDQYLLDTLNRKSVQEFLEKYAVIEVNLHKIYISPSCGAGVAGQTWVHHNGDSEIELSSWILVSPVEVKRVLRHEFAHVLKHACRLRGSAHGRDFTQALRAVCPRTWRKDRHWYPDSRIDKERQKHHPRIKIGVDNT